MRMAMAVAMMPFLEVWIVIGKIFVAMLDLDFIGPPPGPKSRSQAGARHKCHDDGG